MKKRFIFLILTLCFTLTTYAQWTQDILGKGFEQLTIKMPDDYEGAVNCVLVRSLPDTAVSRAVLYVHGFNDYFFQQEQALQYNRNGYAFYAVDLRKYGRSYIEHQKRGNVKNLNEYYADLDTCISIIKKEGYTSFILYGHSMGGLLASLYASDRKPDTFINALILNSPFLDMNFGNLTKKLGVPVISGVGLVLPNIKVSSGGDGLYAESVHKNLSGEWDYDLSRKPAGSIPVTMGWTRAVHKGQKRVRKGLGINIPVLVMHSDKSVYDTEFSDNFKTADAVLNVEDIHKYAPKLGNDITVVVIHDGMHDLVLSRKDVREQVYKTMFSWLKTLAERK